MKTNPTPLPLSTAVMASSNLRAIAAAILAVTITLVWLLDAFDQPIPVWIALTAIYLLLWIATYLMTFLPANEQDTHAANTSMPGNDPWAAQIHLMSVSGQPIADYPTLNKTGILYGALILEEGGEAILALSSAVAAAARASVSETQYSQLTSIAALLNLAAKAMAEASVGVRHGLQHVSDLNMHLNKADALELFDGTTDIAVVNCGFACALGLPGAAGYDEVTRSNLSKVNPATGFIDKDAGGKWIKGPNYFKPDLQEILEADAALRAMKQTGTMAA